MYAPPGIPGADVGEIKRGDLLSESSPRGGCLVGHGIVPLHFKLHIPYIVGCPCHTVCAAGRYGVFVSDT